MCLVVLEAIQVLVSLLAHVALVWLFLLHSLCPRIWSLSVGVNNRECAVTVLMQSLVVVTMLMSG
jgi:hypothetical protein